MKIGLLTSSRADYSIYFPLLKQLKSDPFFDLSVIVFGTHLSNKYGNTINQIIQDGFEISERVDTMPDTDSPGSISAAIGKTISNFSEVWNKKTYDIVFCLGDRFEMFAACASAVPFNIKLAHIHGGEQTLGAIDDVFRNSITHMATYHFPSTSVYFDRITSLKGNSENVYNVGALSIDNLIGIDFLSISAFKQKFNIDLTIPSVLFTFHPETVAFEKNEEYIDTLIRVMKMNNKYQYIITMPNADTLSNIIREKLKSFIIETPNTIGVESFGTLGYLSCMKHCCFMLGNTSSGFVEASYFRKPVINVGHRQDGRLVTPNIVNCEINVDEINSSIQKVKEMDDLNPIEEYGNGNTASKIVSIIKEIG